MERTRRLGVLLRARRLSAKNLIGSVALVPLLAIGWLAASVSWAVASERRIASDVRRQVAAVGALIEIRWRVANEWSVADGVAETERLGLSPEEAESLLGMDLVANAADARAKVDALLASGEHQAISDATERARETFVKAGADDEATHTSVESLFELISNELENACAQLTAAASSISSGGRVVQGTDALASAAELHSAVMALRELLLLRISDMRIGSDDVNTLAWMVIGRREAGYDRLRRITTSDSPTGRALTTATESAAFRYLTETAKAAVDLPVAEGSGAERPAAPAAAAAMAYRAGATAGEEHYAVVKAALENIDAEAVRLDDDVRTSQLQTLVVLGLLVVLTLAAFWFAARAIVRPLRRLAAAAASLRDGDLNVHVDLNGPSEIAATAAALDEAAAGLRLSEAQAGALAAGALDDPVFTMPTPGRLGESLRSAVAALARSLNEREDYRLRLSHEASHDALTGLVNRAAAHDHLGGAVGRSRRHRTTLAVVFIDLNGFKAVNEAHGHDVGDDVLRRVAVILAATVRPDDLVGRFGSDEFVVVAEDVGTSEDAEALARRLVTAVATPVEAGGRTHRLAASAGVRLCIADDPVHRLTSGEAVVELLRDVDAALDRAKAPGFGPVEVFTPDLQRELRDRIELEQALRIALEPGSGQLHLVYQPVVDAHTGEPVGAEALIRWTRPGIGRVGPDEFIPVAERSDLILALDAWVVREAVDQLARWQTAGVLQDRWVSINLSGAHVCRPEVVPLVLDALADAGVDPHRLVLEITERELLADVELAAEHLRILRSAGVQIAIDDFGTGFTSLSHLRWLPIDKLKIDRSFVTNLASPNDESLVRLVIETGHVLGVSVTAEGVETEEHLEALRNLGADYIQGYLTGRPEAPIARPAR